MIEGYRRCLGVYLQGSADKEEKRGPNANIIIFGGECNGEAGHSHEEDGPHERCRRVSGWAACVDELLKSSKQHKAPIR